MTFFLRRREYVPLVRSNDHNGEISRMNFLKLDYFLSTINPVGVRTVGASFLLWGLDMA